MSEQERAARAPEVDASAVDAAQFAQSISGTPDEQLREGMAGPMRDQILDEIFRRMEAHFNADAATGVEAVIHWRIGGRADGGSDEFEVKVSGGQCSATRGFQVETARVTFELDGVDFLKLVTGNVQGPALFMSGQLKIQGDLMFAPQINSLFRVPTSG